MNTQQNKLLQITDEHKLFVVSNINFNPPINYYIASLWCPNKSFIINASLISEIIPYFNLDSMLIILITDNEKLLNEKNLTFNQISFLNVNLDGFKKIMSNDNINQHLAKTLFIADRISWAHIIIAAKESETLTTISGGSNNKRHLISILDTRLVTYLIVIFKFNLNLLNSHNGFDTIYKPSILPFMDSSKKGQSRFTSCEGILEILPHIESLDKTQSAEKNINTYLKIDINGFNSTQKRSFHMSSRLLNIKNEKASVVTYVDDI